MQYGIAQVQKPSHTFASGNIPYSQPTRIAAFTGVGNKSIGSVLVLWYHVHVFSVTLIFSCLMIDCTGRLAWCHPSGTGPANDILVPPPKASRQVCVLSASLSHVKPRSNFPSLPKTSFFA